MSGAIALIGLALVDSLSIGTLVIPVALMVKWGSVRRSALTAYLGTVAIVYFGLGIAILLGLSGIGAQFEDISQSRVFAWVTLVLGVVLAGFGIFGPNPVKPSPGEVPERVAKSYSSSLAGMIALGLGASLAEAATMLPYIAAMGIVGSFEAPFVVKAGVVALYCALMVMPAIGFALCADLVGKRFFGRMQRMLPKLQYETKITLLWVAAIVGIILIVRSVGRLRAESPETAEAFMSVLLSIVIGV